MAATREDVDRWIETARKNGKPFIISVCDTFEYDDYPIYCSTKEEVFEQHQSHDNVNMQKINEIIHVTEKGAVENLNIYNIKNI